jgi:hypothetical protein
MWIKWTFIVFLPMSVELTEHHWLKGYPFSIGLLLRLFEKYVEHVCMYLLLRFLFYSIDLSVYLSANTTLS